MSWISEKLRAPHLVLLALIVAGGLSVAFHGTIFGQTRPHGPAASPQEVAAAQSQLEEAHQRGAAQQAGDDDGAGDSREPADSTTRASAAQSFARVAPAISPERAVMLARQAVPGHDDGAASVAVQTQNGAQIYVVKLRAKSVSIDANTGSILSIQ